MADYEIDHKKLARQAIRSLTWRLRITRGALLVERVARHFWPLIAWTLAFVAVARFGLLLNATQSVAVVSVGAGVLGWLVLFARGVRGFRWPTEKDAKARLDADLPGRPLEALEDTQAIGARDAGARFLWARHLQRMADLARGSKAARPHVRLARQDPWAFRLIAVLMFAGAVLFGRSDPVQSLVQSLQPDAPVVASGPSWEGWAEPPAYTGRPAVYLNEVTDQTELTLPEGTRVTLRIYGETEGAVLQETVSGSETGIGSSESGIAEVFFEVRDTGRIVLSPPRGTGVAWDVAMIADEDPQVALTGDITRTVQGALKMPFEARDDYGVVGGQVTIDLALDAVDRRHGLALPPEPRETVSLDVPLPFTRKTTSFNETVIEDLAEHPWAGLPVQIIMSVEDELGQKGVVIPEIGPMPGKRFFDTLAGAVAEQRRDLLWNRENAARITMILKAITHQPEVAFERRGEKPYLIIRTALRRLEYNADGPLSDEIRDEVAELLWKAALLIEDGDLADARERFKRAQERLEEAMRNGATQQEIEELMNEMRQAMQEYMRQLAQEQRNEQNRQAESGERTEVTQDQLQQMMDRIQELMEQGRMAEAQELMQQLQEMMENMRVTEQQGQGGENQQAMEGLGETLREQQDLADDTFRQLQEQFNQQGQNGNPQGGEMPDQNQQPGNQQGGERQGQNNQRGQGEQRGEGQGMTPGDLAERQQALREMLDQQRRQFDQNGVDGGEEFGQSLDEAERQMGEAERNLEEGNSADALDNQADAMEALREGMRQLGEAQRQAQAEENGRQGNQAGRAGQQERDPLGRPLSESGQVGTNERLVPTEDQYRRSREVMDEIRKRSGDRSRPSLELDYLRRLLDRF